MADTRKMIGCFLIFLIGLVLSASLYAEMVFHFIDVGQGDAIFISTPCDTYILIDAGLPSQGGDTIVSYLNRMGITKIDKVIATHQHNDHTGGMGRIYNNFEVDVTYDSGYDLSTNTAKTYRDLAQEKSEFKIARAFDTLNIDCEDTTITFIHPYEGADGNIHYMNLVLHVQYKEFSALFMGDAEAQTENVLLDGNEIENDYLPAQLLKVGHHGSNSGTAQSFLDAVSPEVAVIQVGEGNQYGHPHQEVLERLYNANVEVWRTDNDGTIVIVTDGYEYFMSDPDEHIQDNIIYEELRDGIKPEGWTAVDIEFRTTGDGYARFTDIDAELITPILDLTGYENIELKFDVAKFGTGGDGPLTVEISDDGGETWDAQTFDSPVPEDAEYLTSGPTEITVTGEEVQIRWSREDSLSQKRLRDVLLTGDPVGPTSIPSFAPPGGIYFDTLYVELSSETPDADIWYTLDGSDPADPANEPQEYEESIEISENTTIKAYAESEDREDSAVITMDYIFPVQVADIADLRDKAGDGIVYQLTGEAVVTFKSTEPSSRWFIQDETGAVMMYDPDDIIVSGYEKGNGVINLTGVVSEGDGMIQLVPAADSGEVVSEDETFEAEEVTIADLDEEHRGRLITLKNMEFTGEKSTFSAFNSSSELDFEAYTGYTFEDQHDQEIVLYTYCNELDFIGDPVPQAPVHITGIHGVSNETLKIYPRSGDDIGDATSILDWFLY